MENILTIPANEFDHHRGEIDSPVVLVQYGDYECPYSAALAGDLDLLYQEYKGILCHIYRHFPQTGIHDFSEFAALAAEAASEQNQFWQLHSLLYQNTEELSADLIRLLARKAHLDMDQFENDIGRFELMDKIYDDYANAAEAGVKATPTVFINGVQFLGSSSYWPLKEAIELANGNFRSAWY